MNVLDDGTCWDEGDDTYNGQCNEWGDPLANLGPFYEFPTDYYGSASDTLEKEGYQFRPSEFRDTLQWIAGLPETK